MERIRHFLRQFEVLGTDLRHRYRSNLFFRATLYIVGLQAAFIALLIAAFGITLYYSNLAVAQSVISYINDILSGAPGVSPEIFSRSISNLQAEFALPALFGIALLAILSGIILAYAALRPVRNTLQNQKLFMENIAHELRTPLSVMKTLSEVSLLDEKLPPSAQETFRDILEEVDRSSGVINNLLSLNRLLRPERMQFANTDFGEIIERVIARRRSIAEERAIEIIFQKPSHTQIWGNGSALEQIVANLLSNAMEYTPAGSGGKVVVSLEPAISGMIAFSVSDNGIGIADADLLHIFEPFYRAEKSRTRNIKQSGSGLGLSIVHEIVRAHRGKIHIQTKLGKGTTVSVFLPSGEAVSKISKRDAPLEEGAGEIRVDFSEEFEQSGHPILTVPRPKR